MTYNVFGEMLNLALSIYLFDRQGDKLWRLQFLDLLSGMASGID